MDLHLKYRPSNLISFLGNKGVVASLKSLLKTPPHTYMFVGGSGCGKTTLSRIVAKEVGCNLSSIMEINAADCNGIDFMRDLIKEARFSPMEGGYKAYILDEFHQVSQSAQNALLKIFEDTPSHVFFMICTTNPEKVITTIKNRCHIFSVNPLQSREIRELLGHVIHEEGIVTTKEIIEVIVESCNGTPRTALILLSTLSGVTNVEDAIDLVYTELYNTTGIADLCKALVYQKVKWKDLLQIVDSMDIKDYEKIRIAMLGYYIGWIKNCHDVTSRKDITGLANICAIPFNYSTAKYDFILMLSQIFGG